MYVLNYEGEDEGSRFREALRMMRRFLKYTKVEKHNYAKANRVSISFLRLFDTLTIFPVCPCACTVHTKRR